MSDEKVIGKIEPAKVIASMEEVEAAVDVEYAMINGFKPGQVFRIGSLTAGDMIVWSEANEGEAKRTAGIRLICKSLVGPEPENVRYALDPANIAIFRKKSHKVAERIVKEILKLNGMEIKKDGTTKAEDEAKKD